MAALTTDCAAPLVVTDPDEENPFFSGTCFRVKWGKGICVLTARHCLENHSIDLSKHRLQCATTEGVYLPLKNWHLMGTISMEDTDQGDIAIFEADIGRMNEIEIASIPALNLTNHRPLGSIPVGSQLLIEGYPSNRQEIDYENRRWERGSAKLLANFDGVSSYNGLGKLSFIPSLKSAELDGLSGSPVFLLTDAASPHEFSFAGMLIRSGHFICSTVIIHALKISALASARKDS